MFAKHNRLSTTRDVQRVFTTGRSFFGSCFTIRFLNGPAPLKATVSVSTKISKSAVRRNTIKRVVRELVRANMEYLISGSYVFIARSAAGRLPNEGIREELERQLVRCRLLRK